MNTCSSRLIVISALVAVVTLGGCQRHQPADRRAEPTARITIEDVKATLDTDSPGAAEVKWRVRGSENGVTGYTVIAHPGGSAIDANPGIIDFGGSTEVPGLAAGHDYTFSVTALIDNAPSATSSPSNTIAIPGPTQPLIALTTSRCRSGQLEAVATAAPQSDPSKPTDNLEFRNRSDTPCSLWGTPLIDAPTNDINYTTGQPDHVAVVADFGSLQSPIAPVRLDPGTAALQAGPAGHAFLQIHWNLAGQGGCPERLAPPGVATVLTVKLPTYTGQLIIGLQPDTTISACQLLATEGFFSGHP